MKWLSNLLPFLWLVSFVLLLSLAFLRIEGVLVPVEEYEKCKAIIKAMGLSDVVLRCSEAYCIANSEFTCYGLAGSVITIYKFNCSYVDVAFGCFEKAMRGD